MFQLRGSRAARRVAATLAAVGLTATALVACSGGGNSPSTDSATSGEVVWWGWSPDVTVADTWIAAFNKDHPDIKVTYKNFENQAYGPALSPALRTNAGPDVYDMSLGGGQFGVKTFGSYALDLLPAVEKNVGADWQQKYAFDHKSFLDQGKLRALSIGGVGGGFLWVNQSLFDELKVKVPKTYDEWVKACAVFRSAGKDCLTVGAAGGSGFTVETLHTIVNNVKPGLWAKAQLGEADWNDPAVVEGLTIFDKMHKDGIITKDALALKQYPDANNTFMSGKAAMVQMGTWYAQYARKAGAMVAMEGAGVKNPVPFVQLPADFPDVSGKGNKPVIFGEVDYGLGVNAKSKNPEASTTFVTWMTGNKDGATTVANTIDLIPNLIGVQPKWDEIGLVDPKVQAPALAALWERNSRPDEWRGQYATPEAGQALDFAVTSILEGSATPQKAADLLQTTLRK